MAKPKQTRFRCSEHADYNDVCYICPIYCLHVLKRTSFFTASFLSAFIVLFALICAVAAEQQKNMLTYTQDWIVFFPRCQDLQLSTTPITPTVSTNTSTVFTGINNHTKWGKQPILGLPLNTIHGLLIFRNIDF